MTSLHNTIAAIVVVVAAFPSSTHAATTLEQGLRRETALLVTERDALRRERERVDVEHDAHAAALRATIAGLEARVVEATAREEALRAALQARVSSSVPLPTMTSSTSTTPAAVFASLESPVPSTPVGVDAAVASLPLAVERLRARAAPQTLATDFFDVDGALVAGKVTQGGAAAWAAADANEGPAGVLMPVVDGARQIANADANATANARAFVHGGRPALLPLVLAHQGAGEGPAVVLVAGFTERLTRLGGDGVVLCFALVASFALALVPLLRLLQEHRAVAVVAGRLPALVRAGESSAAGALVRTVPGTAGRFLGAVVTAVTSAGRAHPEDEVAALSAEAGFSFERVNHAARLGAVMAAAAVVVVAARAASRAIDGLLGAGDVSVRVVLDALAGAILPLEMGALVAVPWALALIVCSAVVVRARERLDVLALRVLDAAGHESR
jgi:hypothetical protein